MEVFILIFFNNSAESNVSLWENELTYINQILAFQKYSTYLQIMEVFICSLINAAESNVSIWENGLKIHKSNSYN